MTIDTKEIEQVRPTVSFGNCEDCPPATELGEVAFYFGLPILLAIIVISLIAGYKTSKSNWILPIACMAALGLVSVQASAFQSSLYKQHAYRMIEHYRQGPPVSHPDPNAFIRNGERLIPQYEQDIHNLPNRYKRVFFKGWLVYSIAPFILGFLFSILWRRRPSAQP